MKQHKRWLYLLLAGGILLEISACAQKESMTPSEPDHMILDDYEIRYKGFTVMSDINHNQALVISLDFTNNGKEVTFQKYLKQVNFWLNCLCQKTSKENFNL